jgi:competence protein ComEA
MKVGANQLVQGLILLFLGVGLGAGGLGLLRGVQPAPIYIEPAPPTATPLPWQVHVTGEVNDPGVYVVEPGMIVADAIELAGGLTAQADVDRVNLALRLRDGLQVFVPALGETVVLPTEPAPMMDNGNDEVELPAAAPPAPGEKINLNTASLEELDSLPGVGPSTAQSIIDYRTQNGPFARIEDVMNVPGIGEGKFNEMKELITVGEP